MDPDLEELKTQRYHISNHLAYLDREIQRIQTQTPQAAQSSKPTNSQSVPSSENKQPILDNHRMSIPDSALPDIDLASSRIGYKRPPAKYNDHNIPFEPDTQGLSPTSKTTIIVLGLVMASAVVFLLFFLPDIIYGD